MELSTINGTDDTIAAIATAPGTGGIAVIRLSGPDAFEIAGKIWKGTPIAEMQPRTAHLGNVTYADGSPLDEVVLTKFRAPASFTGEDTVEIACHGSHLIQKELVEALVRSGARAAGPGEFSQRAFLNGRLDLAQAEAIADLIAASSRAAHRLALSQMNGNFSRYLDSLRQQLIEFAALVELELDFSEEDVEFADRVRLQRLAHEILDKVCSLADSYTVGKVFKEGISVAIAGVPNAGKSTLLNRILDDDKAIVSDIPGTTRDTIEATRQIGGILFRFIDTAGLRDTDEAIESIGIERARKAIGKAYAVIWLIDATADIAPQLDELQRTRQSNPEARFFIAINKADLLTDAEIEPIKAAIAVDTATISAAGGEGTENLMERITAVLTEKYDPSAEIIVTNARHCEALLNARQSLKRVLQSLDSELPADLLAHDIRETIAHLSAITGAITTPHLLHHIFSSFCIGK